MHPDIAQAIAQAHIDDLHRAAARQRLVRSARAGRAHPGKALTARWSALRSTAGRLTVPAVVARRQPDCCPA